jgi:hypothetical protein
MIGSVARALCGGRAHDGARGLRRVLMDEWDPIGVAHSVEAQDEYDTYLGISGACFARVLLKEKSRAT